MKKGLTERNEMGEGYGGKGFGVVVESGVGSPKA
jgi:hypothetical protein